MTELTLPLSPDSFELYMNEINRIPLLGRDEEQELARHWRKRQDLSAAHKLICANLRFVVKIAREYQQYGMRLPDLVQEGNIGLMMAVKKFDPERGIRLITYAVWWIRAYIQSFIIRSWSLVKIGTTQAQKRLFFKLAQTREAILRLSGAAEADDIAAALSVSGQEVAEMSLRLARRDTSIDVDLAEGDGYTLSDTLADDRDNQEMLLSRRQEEKQLAQRVQRALMQLNERERHIIHERILTDDPRTLQDLAEQYNISRERVRQLESNALRKLKHALEQES